MRLHNLFRALGARWGVGSATTSVERAREVNGTRRKGETLALSARRSKRREEIYRYTRSKQMKDEQPLEEEGDVGVRRSSWEEHGSTYGYG